jgi:integrase
MFLATGKYVKDKDSWNEGLKMVTNGSNFKLTNTVIGLRHAEAVTRLLEAEAAGEPLTRAVFVGKKLIDFETYAKDVRGDGYDSLSFIKKGRRFNGGKEMEDGTIEGGEIDIRQININWLRRFQNWLVKDDGYAHNSMVVCMKFYQLVCNQALREGFIKYTPFGEGKYLIPAPEDSLRVFLVAEERERLLKGLLNKEIKKARTHKVLAYFLLGVFSGIRYSDWALFEANKMIIKEPTGDFILLKPQKTGGMVRMEIGKSLAKVLEVIREVGPLTSGYKAVMAQLKMIGEFFKLEKTLTTHVGRHTFGFICASIGVPKSTTALWMGITEATVDIYYHLTGESVKEHSKMMADV